MAVQVLTYDGLKYTVDLIQDRIDGVACDIASSATTLNDSLKELSCRVDELERAFSDITLALTNHIDSDATSFTLQSLIFFLRRFELNKAGTIW